MLTPDWHCVSEPKDLFELVRTEDIASLDAEVPVKRIKLVAADGATNYKREYIDAMDITPSIESGRCSAALKLG